MRSQRMIGAWEDRLTHRLLVVFLIFRHHDAHNNYRLLGALFEKSPRSRVFLLSSSTGPSLADCVDLQPSSYRASIGGKISSSLFCEDILRFMFQHLYWPPRLLVEGDLLRQPEVGLLPPLLCSQPSNGNYDCDCDDFYPLILIMMITAMMMIMT